ncbi:hypothetical protein H4696_006423 [Amycolatopsis lexingtonensis]|uniref:Uncharacterized protein n=1 Tax=Amycolatopsis lexingtonensis TaxID=218822 RepID=A0ABR9I853_9PSEU|nr:hypothetical protein [Amycolatopsis lexingtonensis]MBE1499323.1 hypothetical protein [Amycolatopsis lexingtonensis]
MRDVEEHAEEPDLEDHEQQLGQAEHAEQGGDRDRRDQRRASDVGGDQQRHRQHVDPAAELAEEAGEPQPGFQGGTSGNEK